MLDKDESEEEESDEEVVEEASILEKASNFDRKKDTEKGNEFGIVENSWGCVQNWGNVEFGFYIHRRKERGACTCWRALMG